MAEMSMIVSNAVAVGETPIRLATDPFPCSAIEIYFDDFDEPNGNATDAAVMIMNAADATGGVIIRKGASWYRDAPKGALLDLSDLWVVATQNAQTIQVCVYG